MAGRGRARRTTAAPGREAPPPCPSQRIVGRIDTALGGRCACRTSREALTTVTPMSGVTRPRGPLPARVYWVRRALVLGLAVVLVFAIGRLLQGFTFGGDESPESQAK